MESLVAEHGAKSALDSGKDGNQRLTGTGACPPGPVLLWIPVQALWNKSLREARLPLCPCQLLPAGITGAVVNRVCPNQQGRLYVSGHKHESPDRSTIGGVCEGFQGGN